MTQTKVDESQVTAAIEAYWEIRKSGISSSNARKAMRGAIEAALNPKENEVRKVLCHRTWLYGKLFSDWHDGDINPFITKEMEEEWVKRGLKYERAYE